MRTVHNSQYIELIRGSGSSIRYVADRLYCEMGIEWKACSCYRWIEGHREGLCGGVVWNGCNRTDLRAQCI
jgi:hypothetical protein